MKRLSISASPSIFWIIAAAMIVAVASAFLLVARSFAVDLKPGANEHLMIVHDRGVEKGFLTQATTMKQAIEEAGISLGSHDLVEPSLDEELVSKNYQVNIYRAVPILVVDGASTTKVLSAHQTPEQIAEQAGVKVQDEDNLVMKTTGNIVDSGAALRLDIDRATAFKLVLYGKETTAYSQETTVEQMLDEKKIKIGEKDTLSVDKKSKLTEGMTVELWRNGKQTITEEQAIAFPIKQIQDVDREVGYRDIKSPGTDGKKIVTFEVDMKNGKENSRKEIQSVVTKEPTEQVEVVGAKRKSFGGTCDEWIAGAGITDLSNASYLIGEESGCNPYAVNPSSGACGVGQALPCSKTGCEMGDGACQIRWMNSYVQGRYGSWQAAADHHRRSNWY